ncbi:hypothetical protein LEP1GSC116_4294 [Leptospira interrogans serovar Icterohaemorrhagiae str. Verdun HP]|uniref:Uncharacterized protein n=1 Tax=Leptospira interrogans serovar Icterohaemorrhagiae str. Verdun HP TaxID=1049910 RepID=M6RF94_LEPIR|nr:hypothetical protein LEP1GSC116_4294 [Leptospira interrogans serovar Icterohaemorrhagiae str. Verdun HP]
MNFFYTIKNYIFFYKFQFRRYIFSNQKTFKIYDILLHQKT